MNLNPDFSDLLRAFAAFDVRYLIVGAHALAVHARPRSTGDLDVWVEPTIANARRVYAGLSAFGAPLDGVSIEDFTTPDTVFQVGIAPVRIDVLTEISGIPHFEPAYERAVEVRLDDVRARVIGRDDFLANKRASGRPKDLQDVAAVERIQRLRQRDNA